MDDFLAELNEKQREAVVAPPGPLLIIAGPGSGKTKTLAYRIAYLIAQGEDPRGILAVTFTNKAAGELKERVGALLESAPQEANKLMKLKANEARPLVGTFHSICARFLRQYGSLLGYTPNFTIYDEDDQERLIKHIMEGLGMSPKEMSPSGIAGRIDRAKDELVGPDDYDGRMAQSPIERAVYTIYPAYQKELQERNAMDFADLLFQTARLFRERPDILNALHRRFRHILVDEYQDTNGAQYHLVRQLAQAHKNICCVGDDSQSIYSWRGADFRNILRFEEDWPDARVVVLDQNYRSTQTILDAATALIARNTRKKDKALWTHNGAGIPIALREFSDERREAEFVAGEIERVAEADGLPFADFAVLYRTNAQSRALEEAFFRRDMPYALVGGEKFYQRKEIKDLVAYLRFIANPRDMGALERIINIPPRGIGKKLQGNILGSFIQNPKSEILNPKQIQNSKLKIPNTRKNAVEQFFSNMEKLRETSASLPPHELIKKIVKTVGYEQYLRDGTDKGEERWENVGELVTAAYAHAQDVGAPNPHIGGSKNEPTILAGEDITNEPSLLQTFLEKIALVQETDKLGGAGDRPTLMTMHAAKGLEFATVFIVGCEEGVLPHARSAFDFDQLEEERRLCYVGITRAKQKLYLTFARRRTHFGSTRSNPPSSFLFEIPQELVEFQPLTEETEYEHDEETIRWF